MKTQNDHLKILLRLRILTAYLGERSQYGWWTTAFYEHSSHLFVEPVFVKTSRLAQYHGAVEAARRLHDEHLSVGCFHLFRLTEELEQDLHEMVLGGSGSDALTQTPQSSSLALDELRTLAGPVNLEAIGPKRLGYLKDLALPDVAASTAAAYAAAFRRGVQCYPYLVA